MPDENSQPLRGEVIWITGASSGIGRALALAVARAGAVVIASGRNEQSLAELQAQHDHIHPLVYDVTDAAAADATRRRLQEISPVLHRVVMNAGNCEYLDISDPDWSMLGRIMAINYQGAVNTLEVALPLLRQLSGTRGHIIGVASQSTFAPFPRAEVYGASKAALTYMLNALRLDLKPCNIDVSVVNPGFVKTPLTDKNDFPMPFLITPQQAAERMLEGIVKRRRQIDFPRRLKWLLKLMCCVPSVWYDLIGPRLTKSL